MHSLIIECKNVNFMHVHWSGKSKKEEEDVKLWQFFMLPFLLLLHRRRSEFNNLFTSHLTISSIFLIISLPFFVSISYGQRKVKFLIFIFVIPRMLLFAGRGRLWYAARDACYLIKNENKKTFGILCVLLLWIFYNFFFENPRRN